MLPRTAALFLALGAAACGNTISCQDQTDDLGALCLPGTVAAGIPATVEVRELCGLACTGVPGCTALLRNGQVVLDVRQEVCSDSATASCLNQGCQHRTIDCVLPALPAGDWTLIVPGGPARLIHVAGGGDSSCRFASPDGGVQ
jgi:hypothetical protein